MTAPLSLMTRSVLEQLEMLRKERDGRESVEQMCDNRQDGVASTDPANMRAPWAGATPLAHGARHSGVDE